MRSFRCEFLGVSPFAVSLSLFVAVDPSLISLLVFVTTSILERFVGDFLFVLEGGQKKHLKSGGTKPGSRSTTQFNSTGSTRGSGREMF